MIKGVIREIIKLLRANRKYLLDIDSYRPHLYNTSNMPRARGELARRGTSTEALTNPRRDHVAWRLSGVIMDHFDWQGQDKGYHHTDHAKIVHFTDGNVFIEAIDPLNPGTTLRLQTGPSRRRMVDYPSVVKITHSPNLSPDASLEEVIIEAHEIVARVRNANSKVLAKVA
jgi:hypothetical protein